MDDCGFGLKGLPAGRDGRAASVEGFCNGDIDVYRCFSALLASFLAASNAA